MRNKKKHVWNAFRIGIVILGSYSIIVVFNRTYSPDASTQCSLKGTGISNIQFKTPLAKTNATYTKMPSCPHGGIPIHDVYCALPFWAISERNPNVEAVSLCTQGTYEFLHHIKILCERWQGPISVAVYCFNNASFEPVADFIASLRYCDTCIAHWVDWHLFYDKNLTQPPPTLSKIVSSNSSRIIDCNFQRNNKPLIQQKGAKDIYPINVGRNLARSSTNTPYVFSIDIELYPSSNIRLRFEKMIREYRRSTPSRSREVWVLPVFEIKKNYNPPTTKSELRTLYSKKIAISFHKYRCNSCHKIPNLTDWLNHVSDYENTSLHSPVTSLQPLRTFSTVKRNRKFQLHYWEPFFIGTKNDPEFDHRLSWEGKINKMQMAYEMCLLNYDYHILDDAFLVHSPGINVYSKKKESFRMWFAKKNFAIMKLIKKTLVEIYGKRSDC